MRPQRTPPRGRLALGTWPALTLLSAALLVGCGDDGEGSFPAYYADLVASERAAAAEAGASIEQLAVLDKVIERRTPLTYAEYAGAVERTLACFKEAGLAVNGPIKDQRNGVQVLVYEPRPPRSMKDEAAVGAAQDCVDEHSGAIEKLWQGQPKVVAASERLYRQYRPALVDCLSRHDATVPESGTMAEVMAAVDELRRRDDDPPDGVADGPDCDKESGYAAARAS